MTDDIMPQPYPLWLAEVEAEAGQTMHGRVLGWRTSTKLGVVRKQMVPTVAFVNDQGVTVVIREAVSDATWCLGDTEPQVLNAAERVVADRKERQQ